MRESEISTFGVGSYGQPTKISCITLSALELRSPSILILQRSFCFYFHSDFGMTLSLLGLRVEERIRD